MRTKELFHFIKERYAIHLKKEAGKPKPWTKDPILQSYRFCNVHREDDTVTQWISENWRTPHANCPDLWFAMCVARLVNWPDTMAELGYPVPWNPTKFVKVLQGRKARGEKVFSGAYIVSTNGHTMDKAAYLAEHVLTPLWKERKNLRPVIDASHGWWLWHEALMGYNGMGSFMAAQVVADIKYAPPYLHQGPDWWTFAASGPGSRRGLNRVLGRDKDTPWKESEWYETLHTLLIELSPLLEKHGIPRLHAQDLQNVNCEFDKHERTRSGEGRPRSLYPGA